MMPSENMQSQSQTQKRPSIGGHQSNTSISSNRSHSDSPSTGTSPQQHAGKPKKHIVHHHTSGRMHNRIPSSKGLHKLTKTHGNDGSHADLSTRRNASATNLKKNTSAVALKRNRSAAEVTKRPKSSASTREGKKGKGSTSVHFAIGDTDDGDGAWEEASSSASPAISRVPSRSGTSSKVLSPENSRPTSPKPSSPLRQDLKEGNGKRESSADAKQITERLLQRIPSHNATTTKMSLMTAMPTMNATPDTPTLGTTPKVGSNEDVVSRFKTGSGTPGEPSPYLQNVHKSSRDHEQLKDDKFKRAQSMGNLTRASSDESESALAPRSRKHSTTHAYNPPQQSRTQQKLWLQRASSNMEPQQLAQAGGLGMGVGSVGLHGGYGGPLVGGGAGFEGKDPRIKVQLERTGLEYLVVRRHQDPVGLGLKRLDKLPGADKNKRIPPTRESSRKSTDGRGSYGLSQSMRSARTATGGSYDGEEAGPSGGARNGGNTEGDASVNAILRGMWDKSFDMSASAD